MIYLDQFKLPTHAQEDDISQGDWYSSQAGYTSNPYPCRIFIEKGLSSLDFSDVTILYGGNGSGKSTLLNLITNKLSLKRMAPFNSSTMFDVYTDCCKHKMGSAVFERIGKTLHKAVSCILADDLILISFILHCAPSVSAWGCPPAGPAYSLRYTRTGA